MIPRELLKPYSCGLLTGYFGRCILYMTNDNMAGEGHNHLTAFLLETRPSTPLQCVLEFVCQIDTGETLQMEPSPSCTFPCLCILYHIVRPCRGAREDFRGQRAVCLCKKYLDRTFHLAKSTTTVQKQSNTDFFRLFILSSSTNAVEIGLCEQHSSILFQGTTFPYGTGPRQETLHKLKVPKNEGNIGIHWLEVDRNN